MGNGSTGSPPSATDSQRQGGSDLISPDLLNECPLYVEDGMWQYQQKIDDEDIQTNVKGPTYVKEILCSNPNTAKNIEMVRIHACSFCMSKHAPAYRF